MQSVVQLEDGSYVVCGSHEFDDGAVRCGHCQN